MLWLSITTELEGPATTIRPMLETLGPVNYETNKREPGAISEFLRREGVRGGPVWGKGCLSDVRVPIGSNRCIPIRKRHPQNRGQLSVVGRRLSV